MTPQPVATSYDEITYPGFAFPQTHTALAEAIGTVRGLAPAPANACRVLEIGCGEGGNLIPLAYQYPGSTFIGLDLSATAIVAANAAVNRLALPNIRFTQGDLVDFAGDGAPFDYVIAHGVYSWVPEAARNRIMGIMGEWLAPDGIGFVSYNCLPRSHLRSIGRDLMRFHVRAMTDPLKQMQQARGILELVATAALEANDRDIYSYVLKDQLEALATKSDAVLFHDDLATFSTPFLFHEVAAAAARHGLQYLDEARSTTGEEVPEAAREFLESLPATAVVAREQYRDFILGRSFRDSLFCRVDRVLNLDGDPATLTRCVVGAEILPPEAPIDPTAPGPVEFKLREGQVLTTDHALTKAAMLCLQQAFPSYIPFDALVAAALERLGAAAPDASASSDDVDALAVALLRASRVRAVNLRLRPPTYATSVSSHPVASHYARDQAERGVLVTTMTHGAVKFEDPLVRRLLLLLDGTRDVEAITAAMAAGTPDGSQITPEVVTAHLQFLCMAALLVA